MEEPGEVQEDPMTESIGARACRGAFCMVGVVLPEWVAPPFRLNDRQWTELLWGIVQAGLARRVTEQAP